jgi:hypothetical protein
MIRASINPANRLIKSAVIFLLITLISACTTSDKKGGDPKDPAENVEVDQPEIVEVEPELPKDYSLPTKLKYAVAEGYDLMTEFYPIGWSADGKFAFVREPADEACGCYFFDIVIMDMVSDKILWEWKFNDDGAGETMKSVWKKNYALLKSKLLENKIIQASDFALGKSTFNYKNVKYTLEDESSSNSDWDYGKIQSFRITLSASGLGTKTVKVQSYDEYDMILSLEVVGQLKSPYEDRIAVIYSEIQRGYEGPPNVVQFGLSGSHLMDGFK